MVSSRRIRDCSTPASSSPSILSLQNCCSCFQAQLRNSPSCAAFTSFDPCWSVVPEPSDVAKERSTPLMRLSAAWRAASSVPTAASSERAALTTLFRIMLGDVKRASLSVSLRRMSAAAQTHGRARPLPSKPPSARSSSMGLPQVASRSTKSSPCRSTSRMTRCMPSRCTCAALSAATSSPGTFETEGASPGAPPPFLLAPPSPFVLAFCNSETVSLSTSARR
mmetsp:Transcript_37466/g.71766  ORF Transcript_37466/g.71766 Transcript_37466/m.71766 type:complete len:223 (-) Transcript_37466:364-1032(-)